MKVTNNYRTIEVKEPTVRELDGLAGVSMASLRSIDPTGLSEGAQTIRWAILSVADDPLPDNVTVSLLIQRKPKPPAGAIGSYGINPVSNRNVPRAMEFLYRSHQKDHVRQRIAVGRVAKFASELANVCERAHDLDDDAANWLIPASLLFRHSPPGMREDQHDSEERILAFIRKYIAANQYPPTINEIGQGVELAGSTVDKCLHALRDQGRVTFADAKRRTLRIIR